MSKKEFNPLEWNNYGSAPIPQKTISLNPQYAHSSNSNDDVEKLIAEVESQSVDLTPTYDAWLKVGFALSEEYGENGREYFHRLSKYYSGYNYKETDQQYTKCIKSNGNGVTIKTLFQLAKDHGIIIRPEIKAAPILTPKKESEESEDLRKQTYQFPKSLYPQLPDYLQRVVSKSKEGAEKDIMLLSAITVLSACLPKVSGIYDKRRLYPNLYFFLSAPASAGKGAIYHTKRLVNPIHKELRAKGEALKEKYKIDKANWDRNKNKQDDCVKPTPPPSLMLFIPANSSSTGTYQILHDNKGCGLIFETEGDTLTEAFKSEHGNYSSGFRSAFHHEAIQYYRRTDKEYVEIEEPKLSTLLTGTPKQIPNLIPDAENGLLSRFMFYSITGVPQFKDVFENNNEDLGVYFDALGQEFYEIFNILKGERPLEFHLTKEQQEKMVHHFREIQDQVIADVGEEFVGSLRRLAVIAYRIAMVFTVLRISEEGDISENLICKDEDFENALAMVSVLQNHAEKVLSMLPRVSAAVPGKTRMLKFLEQLPVTFNRQGYLEYAGKLKITNKTAERYITKLVADGLLAKEGHNMYRKP